jgi:hypothetical protein
MVILHTLPFQGNMIAGFVTYRVAVGCYAMSFQDEEETDKA